MSQIRVEKNSKTGFEADRTVKDLEKNQAEPSALPKDTYESGHSLKPPRPGQLPQLIWRKFLPTEPQATTNLQSRIRELFHPLDFAVNPRTEKEWVHQAYRNRADAAEQVADQLGKRAIAMQHRINQQNNEWGRVLEKNLRANEILLMDFFIFPGQEKKSRNPYDPSGLLSQNMALIHVLRILFHRIYAIWYDPVKNTSDQQTEHFLDEFSPENYLNTRINPAFYEQQYAAFDNWLMLLMKKNPAFLEKLKERMQNISFEEVKFPGDIFFMEVNEAEFFHYLIETEKSLTKYIELIGTLRSWTSGYHGRYLVRLKAFEDQDEIRRLAAQGQGINPDSYYSRYAHLMSHERFVQSIRPILDEALTPTKNPSCQFSSEEALVLLDSLSKTDFHHYLPNWLLFIIEHRFDKASGEEDFLPMQKAFYLLSRSPFPREQIEKIFLDRGYLDKSRFSQKQKKTDKKSRQDVIADLASTTLKHLPQILKIMQNAPRSAPRQKPISPDPVAKFRHRISERKFEKLSILFKHFSPTPGKYQQYKDLAEKLLRSQKPEALKIILLEALSHQKVQFPPNAPLAPLFPGPLGKIFTQKMLSKALSNLTTVAKKRKSAVLFSNLLLSWAKNHDINLGKVFGEALENYEIPASLAQIQKDLKKIEEEHSLLWQELNESAQDRETLISKISELEVRKKQLEKDLEEKMAEIKSDPHAFSEQALFQIINVFYNAIRRQYLKKILVAGGEVTVKIMEEFLSENPLSQKNREQSDFLFEILGEIDSRTNGPTTKSVLEGL